MKNIIKTLAVGALALVTLGSSAFAQETVLVQPSFRCTSCGAQYAVKTKAMKDNTIQIKFEKIATAGNPKNR